MGFYSQGLPDEAFILNLLGSVPLAGCVDELHFSAGIPQ